jgi:hypothetical protein
MIMQRLSKLVLLTMTLLTAACNESISPELLDSANTGNSPFAPPPPPQDYTFEIKSTAPLLFNQHLHKTGLGNKTTECKITEREYSARLFSTTMINGQPKPGPNPTYDITCFLDAEENSLFYNGFSLEILASAELCPYVAYEPYFFVQWPVGRSTRSMRTHRCDNLDTDRLRDQFGIQLGCDQAREINGTTHPSWSTPVGFSKYQDLCDFDHTKDKGPNCDEGVIDISEITYTEVDLNGVPTLRPTPRTVRHECGGKATACLAGAGLAKLPEGRFGIMYITEGKAVKEPLEFDSPYSKEYKTNKSVANYVRQCSSEISNSNWSNFRPDDSADAARRRFRPEVLSRYSKGRVTWDAAPSDTLFTNFLPFWDDLPPYASAAHSVDTSRGRTVKHLAADAFLGIGVPTNPYYNFYCLDSAKDIKARIRLAVRDWDRTFTTADNVDLISDIFLRNPADDSPARFNGKMDTDDRELPEDDNPHNDFNDIRDWDDFLSIRLATDQDGLPEMVDNRFKLVNRRMNYKCDGPDTYRTYPTSVTSPVGNIPFQGSPLFHVEDAPWYSPYRFPGKGL